MARIPGVDGPRRARSGGRNRRSKQPGEIPMSRLLLYGRRPGTLCRALRQWMPLMRLSVVLLSAAAAALPAHAQTASTSAPYDIVVIGTGLARPPGTAAFGSVVIDRARLEIDASGRVEDVLRDVAGFQQFRRTDSRAANPTSQGATLRALGGNASSRALVLLDGVPQADPFAGYIPFSALSPSRLSAVRVTRGGGVGPFGAGAVAGTIELESAGPDTLAPVTGRAFYGSRNATELETGIAPRLGEGFVTLDARSDRGDGYVLTPTEQRGPIDIPAHYESWSVGLRAVAPIAPGRELQARALLFDDTRLRGQRGTTSDSRGADASLRLIAHGPWSLDLIGYVQERGFRSGFVSTAADRATATPSLDQFETPSIGLGGKVELRPPAGPDHLLRLGVDTRYTQGRTNELFRYTNGAFAALRRAGGNTQTDGFFIEDDWTLGRVIFTGGARADRWDIRDGSLVERTLATGTPTQDSSYPARGGWRGSYRGGVLWRATDAIHLRIAGYTGFRLPTLNELYRPFRVGADATAANAALGLERLGGGEGGIDLRPLPAVHLALTAFYNELSGAIANVTLGLGPGVFPQVGFVAAGGRFSQRQNVRAIRVTGLEATAEAHLGAFRLNASYALTDARVRADGIAAALDGRRPAQSPANQASATLGWAGPRAIDASITARYSGPQNEDDLGTRRLPEALTADAVLAVPLRSGLRLVGRVENLADTRVVSGISVAGIEDLGTPRTLWIGMTLGR